MKQIFKLIFKKNNLINLYFYFFFKYKVILHIFFQLIK